MASAAVVGLGFRLGDPLIGLAITIVILRITWQSIQTIKTDPGMPVPGAGGHDEHAHTPPPEHHDADHPGEGHPDTVSGHGHPH